MLTLHANSIHLHLLNIFQRSTVNAQARRMNSGTSTTFVHADKKYSFRKAWFSDPATYPLIAVLGAACGLCSGFGIYFISSSKDVRISPQKRHALIRGKE